MQDTKFNRTLVLTNLGYALVCVAGMAIFFAMMVLWIGCDVADSAWFTLLAYGPVAVMTAVCYRRLTSWAVELTLRITGQL